MTNTSCHSEEVKNAKLYLVILNEVKNSVASMRLLWTYQDTRGDFLHKK